MPTVSCPSCELPNERGAKRCHACGARLHPETDELDPTLLALEERLALMRNRLADLDWQVRGVGWLALGVVLLILLVLGPSVGHDVLGDAASCGRPVASLRGDYEAQYAPTLWEGCRESARRWAPVAAGASVATGVGVILLLVRGVRMQRARSEVLDLQREVRSIRSKQEVAVP